jgi:hypothetical protein
MIRDAFRRMRNGEVTHVGIRVIRLALIATIAAAVQVGLSVWLVWVIAKGLP